jgi:hypothetical protein
MAERTTPDPNDLLRYNAGEMTDAEAHAFESKSIDDPFLADAVEGLAGSDRVRLEQMAYGLNQDLKRRLAERNKSRRWIGFQMPSWWPWILLTFLLLMTIAFLVIRSLSE